MRADRNIVAIFPILHVRAHNHLIGRNRPGCDGFKQRRLRWNIPSR
jgi:hypothetical protein